MPFFQSARYLHFPSKKNLIAKQHEYTTDYQHHCHYRYTFQHLVYLIAKQETQNCSRNKKQPAVSSKKSKFMQKNTSKRKRLQEPVYGSTGKKRFQ
mgnify:CR=1 FL=1